MTSHCRELTAAMCLTTCLPKSSLFVEIVTTQCLNGFYRFTSAMVPDSCGDLQETPETHQKLLVYEEKMKEISGEGSHRVPNESLKS